MVALPNRELEADLLRVLGHPARLQILEILAQTEICVCELMPLVGLEQSNLSQHLRLLRKHGVVQARQQGPKVFYRLVNSSLVGLIAAASAAVEERNQVGLGKVLPSGKLTG